jgi:hypothetical protein
MAKIIEKYVDREDKLFYRSLRFTPFEKVDNTILENGITDHLIKVTEKYEATGINFNPDYRFWKTA